MDIALPAKYKKMWERCIPFLKSGRPDDYHHAQETLRMVLGYKGKLKFDEDILVPAAMMHDIGHSAILDEHFEYITGERKLANGKLVHMLTGAKIASDILRSISYPAAKAAEIVDIISIHDADGLSGIEADKFYDTQNKRVFHDFDRLDRFSAERLAKLDSTYNSPEFLKKVLEDSMSSFYFDEFKKEAAKRMKKIKLFNS